MTADETIADPTKVTEPEVEDKGKGKVATEETPADETMDEDDSDDEEAAAEEDGMEEIDTNNIISGSRTRGRVIDFAKAAEENPAEEGEDDEDDDDFQGDDDDKMDED